MATKADLAQPAVSPPLTPTTTTVHDKVDELREIAVDLYDHVFNADGDFDYVVELTERLGRRAYELMNAVQEVATAFRSHLG